MSETSIQSERKCTVEGCSKPAKQGDCCWGHAKQKSRAKKQGGDDSVLSRMGFKTEPAEAPPRPGAEAGQAQVKGEARSVANPRRAVSYAQVAGAVLLAGGRVGSRPRAMLEAHCREWVEATRARALTPPGLQLAPQPPVATSEPGLT